jgi:(p)ppGpp synthase/HD superfamily hydrolase
LNPLEDELVIKARKFAFERHSGQIYDGDGEPKLMHSYHLEMLVQRALQWGCTNPNLISACYLHDVLEDTETTYEEVLKETNYTVAEIVGDVTDEDGSNRYERWLYTAPKIRSSASSTFVKLCDRYANMNHSLQTKSHHLGMYVKEYPLFKVALFNPWQFKNEWADLDQLFKTMKEV